MALMYNQRQFLGPSADEIRQLWMEGANKKPEYRLIMGKHEFPRDPHASMEGVLGQAASHIGLAVVAKRSGFEEDDKTIDKYIHNAIDIYFGVANMGYGWIFPHEKYYSVGIGGLAKDLHNPKKMMTDFLKSNGFNDNYKLNAHLAPVGGIKRNIVSSRVVLSGDAAGFVDSFYGEGIAYAIRSGQIAVEVISDILLSKHKLGSLKNYETICELEFVDNLKYSLILSRMMHRFPGIFFKIFTSNEDVIDKYLEVPALKRTYKSYIKWLIPRVPKYLLFKSSR